MKAIVGTASKSRIGFARSIESDLQAGATVQGMVAQAAVDRIRLAKNVLAVADSLMQAGKGRRNAEFFYRSAISRYYYGMFQAARAVVFVDHDGDDKNSHQELPSALPRDFLNRAARSNDLKDARTRRNNSDYDPYPQTAGHWRNEAKVVRDLAPAFVSHCEVYLVGRGIK